MWLALFNAKKQQPVAMFTPPRNQDTSPVNLEGIRTALKQAGAQGLVIEVVVDKQSGPWISVA